MSPKSQVCIHVNVVRRKNGLDVTIMEEREMDCPYMFPDCLSERVRYMRVEPIDLYHI